MYDYHLAHRNRPHTSVRAATPRHLVWLAHAVAPRGSRSTACSRWCCLPQRWKAVAASGLSAKV